MVAGRVVFMLIIPVDTSEAERIFSLMNDIKTSGRSRLCQQNLAAMMIWHYHGRNMDFKNVPVCEILKEFPVRSLAQVGAMLTPLPQPLCTLGTGSSVQHGN